MEKRRCTKIIRSMKKYGWIGRPLVAYRVSRTLQCITGSHRIVAAQAIGLKKIPVYVISKTVLQICKKHATKINSYFSYVYFYGLVQNNDKFRNKFPKIYNLVNEDYESSSYGVGLFGDGAYKAKQKYLYGKNLCKVKKNKREIV